MSQCSYPGCQNPAAADRRYCCQACKANHGIQLVLEIEQDLLDREAHLQLVERIQPRLPTEEERAEYHAEIEKERRGVQEQEQQLAQFHEQLSEAQQASKAPYGGGVPQPR